MLKRLARSPPGAGAPVVVTVITVTAAKFASGAGAQGAAVAAQRRPRDDKPQNIAYPFQTDAEIQTLENSVLSSGAPAAHKGSCAASASESGLARHHASVGTPCGYPSMRPVGAAAHAADAPSRPCSTLKKGREMHYHVHNSCSAVAVAANIMQLATRDPGKAGAALVLIWGRQPLKGFCQKCDHSVDPGAYHSEDPGV